jgi:hypothetical protein
MDLSNAIIVPTLQDTAFYSLRINLDGLAYIIDFSYSEREDRWYMDFYDEDRNPLLLGIKVVPGYFLYEFQRDFREMPQGDLMCLTAQDLTDPPGWNQLGIDQAYKLVYWPLDPLTN